jgi:hypothetical protein
MTEESVLKSIDIFSRVVSGETFKEAGDANGMSQQHARQQYCKVLWALAAYARNAEILLPAPFRRQRMGDYSIVEARCDGAFWLQTLATFKALRVPESLQAA